MTSKTHVLVLPGLGNSGPEHWQSIWEREGQHVERVLQREWDTPQCSEWVGRLNEILEARSSPAVFAAHSSACALVAHWAAQAPARLSSRIKGALLVAPSDPDGPAYPIGPVGFGPVPMQPILFPTIVVASSDDKYISPLRAKQYADAWGSRFVLLEDAGHINAASGFGPWPDGYSLLESLF